MKGVQYGGCTALVQSEVCTTDQVHHHCMEEADHQYRCGCAVQRRHTISTELMCSTDPSNHRTKECVCYRTTKAAHRVVGGCIYMGE